MKTFFVLLLIFSSSLVFGVSSGLYRIRAITRKKTDRNGAWGINLNTGNKDANMYERASVAVAGLFGLNKTETLYFTCYSDDTGRRLDSDNEYRLEGEDLDARWWSITTYDKDHYLIPNKLNRLSYNGTNLLRDTSNRYTIHLSKEIKEGNWLPVGDQGNFTITIRLYNPARNVYENPQGIELPRVIREESK